MCTLLLLAVLAGVALAGAAGSDGGTTVTVTVSGSSPVPGSSASSPVHSGGGSGSSSPCYWQPLSTANSGPSTVPGTWYAEICPGFQPYLPTQVVFVPTSPASAGPVAVVSPSTVAEQAVRSISLPSPMIELNPSPDSITGLATWLWISPGIWHSYSATASVAGISATAWAVPSSVTWNMGDGNSVVCDGSGTAYQVNIPASVQNTSCSYTYETTSAGQPSPDGDPDDGAFTVTATIVWKVSWTSSVPGEGGTLPSLETSSSVPVRVVQVQSVDSSG